MRDYILFLCVHLENTFWKLPLTLQSLDSTETNNLEGNQQRARKRSVETSGAGLGLGG